MNQNTCSKLLLILLIFEKCIKVYDFGIIYSIGMMVILNFEAIVFCF